MRLISLWIFMMFVNVSNILSQFIGEITYDYSSPLLMEKELNGESRLTFSKDSAHFQFLSAMKKNPNYYSDTSEIVYSNHGWGFPITINLSAKIYRQTVSAFFGDKAIITDSLVSIQWQIFDEHKAGPEGLMLQKAEGKFGGRDYIVWFTRDLAYSFGPHKLHGLPGLIIEASSKDGKVKFRFKNLEIYQKGNGQSHDVFVQAPYNFNYKSYCLALDDFERRITKTKPNSNEIVTITRPIPENQLEIGFKK